MRIDIVAIGSQGDVQPFVALGLGLRDAGYRARLVTLHGFEEFVRKHGLEHLSIGSSPAEIAKSSEGRDWIKKRSSTTGFLRGFIGVARSRIEEGLAKYWEACQDIDALIVSPMGLLVGVHIAERLRIPMIRAQVEPPTVATRYDSRGQKSLKTAIGRQWAVFLDSTFHLLLWNAVRKTANQARGRVLGLPPIPFTKPWLAKGGADIPLLCGISPAVVPKLPDYDSRITLTGYWFLDDTAAWTPSNELTEFVESGPAPVFVGFGSTPFPKPQETTDLVVRALTRAGVRGIVVAGGSGLGTGKLTDRILGIDYAPYGWLFPRVSAAVHQGGAGVTALALRAGIPSVVVPVFGVHPVWGNRLFELGAAPRPIPASRLTEENLTEAIRAVSSSALRQAADALGEQIRRENGVDCATNLVKQHLGVTISPQHAS